MSSREEDIAWLKSTFHPTPKPVLPDDCIEYCLYILDPGNVEIDDLDRKIRLKEVLKSANQLQKNLLDEYIWQRQPFQLELSKSQNQGFSYLHGRTEYGDSIEDEWVIVWLLRELTRSFPYLWAKVTDSDGEFLLIEASGTIPEWLEPEVAENRVWIQNGYLKIITPRGSTRSSRKTEEKLTFDEASNIILTDPRRIMHSTAIEEEAFYRLRNYPDQIKQSIHHTVIRLPRKLAYLLLQKPAFVSPAIEAFYLRDPISLKAVKSDPSNQIFQPYDLVDVSIAFPRVAYAQLRSQEFPILEAWKKDMMRCEAENRIRIETGMKLSAGFEMLLKDKQYQDRSAVREMHLLLEDLDSGEAVGPDDDTLAKRGLRSDDEKWLDIDFADLQQELDNKKGKSGKKAEFGDRAAQENLQRIVKQFESFINGEKPDNDLGLFAESDSDTDELDDTNSDDPEEDKDASFDDDEFSRLMQEMMGMPAEVMNEIRTAKIDAAEEKSKSTDVTQSNVESTAALVNKQSWIEEDQEIEDLSRRIGAELKASGALRSTDSEDQDGVLKDGIEDADELSSDDEDLLDPKKEELAKELLQRLQAQGGASGPAANLMEILAQQYAAEDERKAKINDKGKSKEK